MEGRYTNSAKTSKSTEKERDSVALEMKIIKKVA
jgi:hypothetical protein